MANLSTIVKKYNNATTEENNLERGKIYFWHTMCEEATQFCSGMHWESPGIGKAIVEVWGAGGSGSRNCCCSVGLPGNSPAYVKKTVCMDDRSFMCIINLGHACTNNSTLCFRGCSEATKLFFCSPNATFSGSGDAKCCVCLCAQGGMAGYHACSGCDAGDFGLSPLTKYSNLGFCVTDNGGSGGCGVVCNFGTNHSWIPSGYGGDFNCPGEISCLCVNHCVATVANFNCFSGIMRSSAGVYGPNPQNICYQIGCQSWYPNASDGWKSVTQNIAGMFAHPTMGQSFDQACNSATWCSCYEATGNANWMSHGMGGYGDHSPCGDIRAHGGRGSQGMVRIQWIANPTLTPMDVPTDGFCDASCFLKC